MRRIVLSILSFALVFFITSCDDELGSVEQKANLGIMLPAGQSDHAVHVDRNNLQTIPNNTTTDIQFENEYWDTSGAHSTTTNSNRVYILKSGIYLLSANIGFESNSTGIRKVEVRGTTWPGVVLSEERDALASGGTTIHLTGVVFLAGESNYLTVEVFQNSGGDLDVATGGGYHTCNLSMILLKEVP